MPAARRSASSPGRPRRLIGTHHDTTHRKDLEDHTLFRSQSLEMIANGAPLREVLTYIVMGIERLKPDWRCSILLLDADTRRLGQGIAPSLPDVYNAAIDGLAIGPGVGSCGTAAFTGERVIVEDMARHPDWAAFRAISQRAEIGACWSQPVLGAAREVLGTFAIYHRQPHRPSPDDLVMIERSANLASVAIERRQAQAEEEIRKLAYHDSLTKLPNRRLTGTVRETDTVARLGGDEFVVVLGGLATDSARSADQALTIAEQIARVLARPYHLSVCQDDGSPTVIQHRCSASIGVALFMGKSLSEQELIKRADIAMYQAKEAGRQTVRLFEAAMSCA